MLQAVVLVLLVPQPLAPSPNTKTRRGSLRRIKDLLLCFMSSLVCQALPVGQCAPHWFPFVAALSDDHQFGPAGASARRAQIVFHRGGFIVSDGAEANSPKETEMIRTRWLKLTMLAVIAAIVGATRTAAAAPAAAVDPGAVA